MKYHALKIDIGFYTQVKNGLRQFELRFNDRNYQVGDILWLKPVEPDTKTPCVGFPWLEVEVITIITHEQCISLKPGHVCMGFLGCKPLNPAALPEVSHEMFSVQEK